MRGIEFCIPSYKRCGFVITLDFLEGMCVEKNHIHIFTQTAEEYDAYSKEYSERAVVHYREGSCVSDNRNSAIELFENGTEIVFLDDDLKSLVIKKGKKAVPFEGKDAMQFFEDAFDIVRKSNARIFTLYPVPNGMFMKNSIRHRQFGVGTVFGMIVDKNYTFRREYTVKEDFELCLRTIRDGFDCIRFDFISNNAKHRSKGGCDEFWGSDDECTNRLLIEYSDLIRRGGRNNQVIMRS